MSRSRADVGDLVHAVDDAEVGGAGGGDDREHAVAGGVERGAQRIAAHAALVVGGDADELDVHHLGACLIEECVSPVATTFQRPW